MKRSRRGDSMRWLNRFSSVFHPKWDIGEKYCCRNRGVKGELLLIALHAYIACRRFSVHVTLFRFHSLDRKEKHHFVCSFLCFVYNIASSRFDSITCKAILFFIFMPSAAHFLSVFMCACESESIFCHQLHVAGDPIAMEIIKIFPFHINPR